MIRTWTPESETPPTPPGTVDYHTVKAWFQKLRDLADEIDNIQLEVQRLRDNATRCTANMSGMPSGSGYGDKISACAEKVDEKEHRRQALEVELHALRKEADRRIQYVAGTKCSELMRLCLHEYYVCDQKQIVIARTLKLPNENRVALYIREGAKHLSHVWDNFM